jgi:hypothetical protein
MNTWAPLWSQVVESTLWEEPLEVRVLFLTMLAIKDPDHVVRMPLRRLVKKAQMEVDLVESALKVLMSPDTKSLDEQPEEGRRLKEVEGGWLVINGEHYRKEMSRLMTRFRKSEWQKKKRHSEKSKITIGSGPSFRENVYVKEFGDGKDVDAPARPNEEEF